MKSLTVLVPLVLALWLPTAVPTATHANGVPPATATPRATERLDSNSAVSTNTPAGADAQPAISPATGNATFPGTSEVQAVAYKRASDVNLAGFQRVNAFMAVDDVPAGTLFYTGQVGVTSFGANTVEAGAGKFCNTSACSLHPFGAALAGNTYQRNVDTTALLGGGLYYIYDVAHQPRAMPGDADQWVGTWVGLNRSLKLITTSGNTPGYLYAFSAGNSVGPFWGQVRVSTFSVGAEAGPLFSTCYSSTDARNLLEKTLPTTTVCGYPAEWTHVYYPRSVYIPAVQSAAVTR